jgi:hypothetical protein
MTSKCLASDRLTALSVTEIQTIKLPERIKEREKERERDRESDTERSLDQESRVEEEMVGLDIHSP